MKKILSVLLVFATIIFVGCGGEKPVEQVVPYRTDKVIHATQKKTCTCLLEVESIDTFVALHEAGKSNEFAAFYASLLANGKILLIKEDTHVACYYSEEHLGFIPVVFYEGEYKGRRAYVLSNELK